MSTTIGFPRPGLGVDPLGIGALHLLLDVVQQGVERPFDHRPEILALPL